jgi:hypothetical protein
MAVIRRCTASGNGHILPPHMPCFPRRRASALATRDLVAIHGYTSRLSARQKAGGHPLRMAPFNENGGETGIRTRETTFAVYSLSRRAPSTYSAISPCVITTNNSPRPRWVRVVPDASAVDGSAFVAEGVGFEPTSRCRETVFKTAAFDHSAIPPANSKNLAPPVGKGQQFLSAAERFVVDISQAGV